MSYDISKDERIYLDLSHKERMYLAEKLTEELQCISDFELVNKKHADIIAPLLIEEKYDNKLVCMYSSISGKIEPWNPIPQMKVVESNQPSQDLLGLVASKIREGYILTAIMTRDNQPLFHFIKRKYVEYNHMYVQLCTCVIIEDSTGKLLILNNSKDSEGRVKERTFIQGHVEVNPNINKISALDYLRSEALREIYEEIKGLPEINPDELTFEYIIHDNTKQVSMEHLIVVFKVVLNHRFSDMRLESNEGRHILEYIHIIHCIENVDNIVSYYREKYIKELFRTHIIS